MKHIVFVLCVLCILLLRTSFVQAVSSSSIHIRVNGQDVVNTATSDVPESQASDYIERYVSDTTILPTGVIHISESIEYFFDTPRHGIVRTIPYIKMNAEGKKYVLSITGFQVVDQLGNPIPHKETYADEHIEIKIGDANKTVSGLHTYVVTFDIAGAITYFPGHDELYWNAIGGEWDVPIKFARATFALPSGISQPDIHAECFVGILGSNERACWASVIDGVVVVQSTRALAAREGLTAVTALPKGVVAILEPKELIPFLQTLQGKIMLFFLGLVAVIWYILLPILIIRKWWIYGRDPKSTIGEARAWFSPPKTRRLRDLTPAETGTLVDESADMRDIYASIVDLARRGYMKIIENKLNDFSFKKMKNWDGDTTIMPFEKELLDGIFSHKDIVVLQDTNLSSTFESVKRLLYESLVSDGLFPENPQKIRTMYTVLGVLSFMTGNPILLLVSLTFGQRMPRKTLYGSDQAAVARALKNFLTSQEKKLKFQAQRQMMFEKLLPYAIAFGVEEIWARRFKDVGLTKPDWYASSNRGSFNTMVFAHSIGSGMTVSFASSVQYKSSSGFSSGFSSGSGGGGFSGGGGGGGGGGSW